MERDLGCFWHGFEPVPDNAYLVCGECGHCWVTADDLMEAVRLICAAIGATVPSGPALVYHCPLCAHDF